MISFWLSVILPIVLGAICISGIGLTKRFALKTGLVSAEGFLAGYYGLATVIFGFLYLREWGLNSPEVLPKFWTAVVISAIANVFIQLCSAKAAMIDAGEVSLTAPLQAMTPGLITFMALALGEFPGPWGIIGVSLMMVGSYVLLWEKTPEHWLDYFGPLRHLRLLLRFKQLSPTERNKTKVVTLSLASAAIGTVGLLFDGLYSRRGTNLQGIIMGAGGFTAILATVYLLVYLLRGHSKNPPRPKRTVSGMKILTTMFVCALLWVGHIILIWPTYHYVFVAYVGTLKRFSVLFSVLAGWWLFRESDVKKRLWAGALIVAGTILISLDGLPSHLSTQIENLGF